MSPHREEFLDLKITPPLLWLLLLHCSKKVFGLSPRVELYCFCMNGLSLGNPTFSWSKTCLLVSECLAVVHLCCLCVQYAFANANSNVIILEAN